MDLAPTFCEAGGISPPASMLGKSRSLMPIFAAGTSGSHWRECYFADALSPFMLRHLLKVEGGAAK